MKSKINAVIAVVICLLMTASVFTACGKKDNGDTTTTLLPDDTWSPGTETYTPVKITDVELADIVKEALGDDAADFDGNLSSLTDDQLSKVKQTAAKKGYVLSTDEDGKTVIMKDNVPITQVNSSVYDEVLSKADVTNGDKVTPSEYDKISSAADENGVTAVTNDNGGVTIVDKVTTTKITGNNTTTKINANVTTTKKGSNSTTASSGGNNNTGTIPSYSFTTENATLAVNNTAVTKSKGSAFSNGAHCIYQKNAQSTDGSVVAVGSTMENSEGKSTDYSNALIVMYDKDGTKSWDKVISGDSLTSFEDVAFLSDGSIIAVGQTMAEDLVSDSAYKCKGTLEGVMCKFTATGKLKWTKIVGGSQGDMVYAVCETSDGGYVIGGKSASTDGDFKNSGSGAVKAYVAEYDENGNKTWLSALSGTKHSAVHDVVVASDGSVYAAIESICVDGDYIGLDGNDSTRRYSVIAKFSSSGSSLWKKSYYESGLVSIKNLCIGNDGGVVAAGNYTTGSSGLTDGSFKSFHNGGMPGTYDGVIVKVDAGGNTKWSLPLIGFQNDMISGITRINGGYAVCGYTSSSNRDFALTNYGEYDSFVYTITTGGSAQAYTSVGGSVSDRAMGICGTGTAVTICGASTSSDKDFADLGAKSDGEHSVAFIYKFKITQQ